MGVKVTDADVKKSFDQQKKQSFPKEADYQKFLKTSGQSQDDILQRVKLDLLSNKIRDKVVKGKDQVSDAAISDFYNKNKARFAQPEKRDLRVVLTKDKAQAAKALAAAEVRPVVEGRGQEVLDRRHVEGQRRQAARRRPRARWTSSSTTPCSRPSKNKLTGPVKTQYGYYDFVVTGITPASQQSLDQAKTTIKQTLASQNQQKALDAFVEGLHEALEVQDRVLRRLQDDGLQERPEGHADADGDRAGSVGPWTRSPVMSRRSGASTR